MALDVHQSEIEIAGAGSLAYYYYRGRLIGMKDLKLEEHKDESERIDWERFTAFEELNII